MFTNPTEPVASVPICCYCDADLSCASCGREQPASPNPPATGEVREALEQIANHPENETRPDGSSYAVGWAFWNVQRIARDALAAPKNTGA